MNSQQLRVKVRNIAISPRAFRLIVVVLAVALTATVHAQTITSIYDFGKNAGDPLNPQLVGAIAQGRDGNMWSTTPAGGLNKIGAAYKITPGGKMTKVHDFDPSKGEGTPFSGLTLGTDGNFYGTMSTGGGSNNGAVFKMTAKGVVTILYSFTGGNDGKTPSAPPVQGTDGNFYGSTQRGGLDNLGTIYKITPKGKLTTLVQLNGTDGAIPVGALIQDTDGSLYGTTQNGVSGNYGTVFSVSPSGKLTVLHTFTAGERPDCNLVKGSDGNFYGTAVDAGAHGFGYVFRITTKGVLTDIYDFTGGSDGGNPFAGLLLAADGAFYGVANSHGDDGFGTVYKITEKPSFSVIAPFNGTDGAFPSVTLVQNTNGVLYGAADQGGATTNTGTFFRITGLKFEKTPFVKLLPASGKVGAIVEILGQGLTGTTAVSFNGTAAQFNVISSTYMTATVPNGATTGFVTVTTANGNLQSNQKFRVTK